MKVLSNQVEAESASRPAAALRILLDGSLAGFAFCLGYRITPAQIFLLVAIGAGAALHLAGQRVFRATGLGRPWLLYALALATGVIAAAPSGASLVAGDAQGVYRLGLAILLVGLIGDAERGFRLAKIFVVAVALQGIVGIVQHFTGWQPIGSPLKGAPFTPGRFLAEGTYPRNSTMAFVTGVSMLFVSAGFVAGALRGRERWIGALLAAPADVANLFTFVRTSWGAVVAGLFSMSAVGRTLRNVGFILAALVAVWGATLALSPAMQEKTSRAVAPEYASNWHRGFIWARTLEMLSDNPVTGIGAGTFTKHTYEYYDAMSERPPVRCHSHNNLLFVWVESGPMGLLAFGWFFAALLASFRRGAKVVGGSDPKAMALILAGAGVAVHFLAWTTFQDPLYDGVIALTTSFALALGLAAIPDVEAPAVEDDEPAPRVSATVAAAGISLAALGGLSRLGAIEQGHGLVAALLLVPVALALLPWMPARAAAMLEGIGILAGAVFLASLPFAEVVAPGTAAWWRTPSALASLAALGCGLAGLGWAIRRPGLVGPAPVAGVLVVAFAAGWVALLEGWLLPYFGIDFNPARDTEFNFVLAACTAGLLLLGWAGPLGFGRGPVAGGAERLLGLPRLVVAGALLVVMAAGLA